MLGEYILYKINAHQEYKIAFQVMSNNLSKLYLLFIINSSGLVTLFLIQNFSKLMSFRPYLVYFI